MTDLFDDIMGKNVRLVRDISGIKVKIVKRDKKLKLEVFTKERIIRRFCGNLLNLLLSIPQLEKYPEIYENYEVLQYFRIDELKTIRESYNVINSILELYIKYDPENVEIIRRGYSEVLLLIRGTVKKIKLVKEQEIKDFENRYFVKADLRKLKEYTQLRFYHDEYEVNVEEFLKELEERGHVYVDMVVYFLSSECNLRKNLVIDKVIDYLNERKDKLKLEYWMY